MQTQPAELPNVVRDIQRPGIPAKEMIQKYSEWAASYDKDVEAIDYTAPKVGTNAMLDLYGNNKSAYILDCGAGTGSLGAAMSAVGFTNMDALDGSSGMLERAKEKKCYKDYICAFLGPHRTSIKDNHYDALVSSGCFLDGHLDGDCLTELIRIVKPGGHIVIVTKAVALHDGSGKSQYLQDLEKMMQHHHDNSLWQWVSTKTVKGYYLHYPGNVYVFKVLGRSVGAA